MKQFPNDDELAAFLDFDSVEDMMAVAEENKSEIQTCAGYWFRMEDGRWDFKPDEDEDEEDDVVTEHQGLPVAGYQSQTTDKVALVNENKILEERVLRQIEKIKGNPEYDPRMAAIAFTGIQEAFMWLNRAVFQPTRIGLPEDTE